jgi:SAM-dependent methyltransferase
MQNSAFPASGPPAAEELVQRARQLIQQQQFPEARQCLEQSLDIKKTALAYRLLGNIHIALREPAKAMPFFQQALETDPGDHASNAMLAEACFSLSDPAALAFSALAIAAAPQEMRYKERFVTMSQSAAFTRYEPAVENTILECLKTPGLDCAALQGLWYNTFTLNPLYRGLYRLTGSGGLLSALRSSGEAGAFDAAFFAKAGDFAPLVQPFFLLGLEKLTVYSKPFEDFIVQLRRALLLQPDRFTPEQHGLLAPALAHYAYNTEYILDVTPEEEQALGRDPALDACYSPLLPPLAEAERVLAEARKTIQPLTPIGGGVSASVRDQYEESPYPKWKSVRRNLALEPAAAPLRGPGVRILIAGCGTGQEAAMMATVLPEAEILAVDLSLSSLAYAKLQTEALGFKNITFRQADILNLGAIPDRFDAIISGGVLHHMQDPLAGWQVLTSLLKDNGLMRIALYSRTARRHIAAARAAVARSGYPATLAGMRAFRREGAKWLDRETLARLMGVGDYYHMSMYRDMVFHVQEHCFDIAELAGALKRLQLEFLNFILPPAAVAQYRAAFPAGPAEGSLEGWHKFEQAQPDTFLGMYQFWCRKTKG